MDSLFFVSFVTRNLLTFIDFDSVYDMKNGCLSRTRTDTPSPFLGDHHSLGLRKVEGINTGIDFRTRSWY